MVDFIIIDENVQICTQQQIEAIQRKKFTLIGNKSFLIKEVLGNEK